MDKRDGSVNQDTKDNVLDENKYRIGDDLPYTPTVEKPPVNYMIVVKLYLTHLAYHFVNEKVEKKSILTHYINIVLNNLKFPTVVFVDLTNMERLNIYNISHRIKLTVN